MNKLAEKVKSLFTEDLVKLVIGFENVHFFVEI